MKKTLKILKRIAIALLIMAASLYLFFEWGGYVITTKAEREAMAKTVKSAPALPGNFLRVYDKVYPGALQSSMWGYVFKGRNTPEADYHTRDAAVDYSIHNRNGSFLTIALTAFLLEDYATPQQCLQFNFSRCDFTHGNIGIEATSQYYFKKPLKDLNDEQVLELLVMQKNPSLYNKNSSSSKRRELFYNRLAALKQKYNSTE